MGWLQEFKIGDVFKGIWSDIKNLPKGTIETVNKVTPKWVKEIDVGEFFSDVGNDFVSGTKNAIKGVGKFATSIVSALTPSIIILAVIALGILIFWKQVKKSIA